MMTFEPAPANPLNWVLWLMLFIFYITMTLMPASPTPRAVRPDLGTPSELPRGSAAAPRGIGSPAAIETVDVSQPAPGQVTLLVSGVHPDGCDAPLIISESRQGNMIVVSVMRDLPADAICTQVLTPFETSIPLAGEFAPGVYTVQVNNITAEFEVK